MKRYDLYVLGPYSIDYEVFHDGGQRRTVAGAVIFSTYAALGSGRRVGALGKLAREDEYITYPFYLHSKDFTVAYSRTTTKQVATYHTADRERRTITVQSVTDPITAGEIPLEADAEVYHMAGLFLGDYDNELFPYLSNRGKLACDLQGFLRRTDGEDLIYKDWEDKEKYIPYVTYLKVDAAEAEITTGYTDRKEAARKLHSWGAKEVIITHNSEVLVYDGSTFYTCPLRPRALTGRTGRGDTTFSTYITERIDHPIEKAILYAAAAVSLKMETFGPYKGTRQDILDYMGEVYPEYSY